jgi:hypothetical protein
MRCKALALGLLLTVRAWSTDTDLIFDTRYVWAQARTDEQVQTAGVELSDFWYRLRFATRLNHSGLNWNAIDYSANADLTPLSWVRLSGRLLHRNRLGDPSSATTLLGSIALQGHWPHWLGYFFELGVFRRANATGTNGILPLFFVSSFTQTDWTVSTGLRVYPTDQWMVQACLATLELVDVYNFNNPIIELAVSKTTADWKLTGYARYQMLLGFGLRDAWVGGLQMEVPLRTASPLVSSRN